MTHVSQPRILAGRAKGTPLETPKRGTRPSPARLRQALFDALQTRVGGRFLDLYAGSGAIGLEAASRGFDVTLVERNPAAMQVLRRNARKAHLDVTLVEGDALAHVKAHANAYDLVFAAPPYTEPLPPIFEAIVASQAVTPGGVYLLQHPSHEPLTGDVVARAPAGTRVTSRRYGSNTVTWLRVP